MKKLGLISTSVEPNSMLVIGGAVLFLALAIFLLIWDIIHVVKK